MKFGIFFVSVMSVVLFSCSSGKNLIQEVVEKDTVKTVLYFKGSGNNKKLVKEVKYFDNDQVMSEQNFKKGALHGEWKTWNKGGLLQSEGAYEKGKKNGAFKFYDNLGVLMYEGTMEDGMKQGVWTTWYDEVQIEEQKEYKNDKPHGKWVYWYIDGNLKLEEYYQDGVKVKEVTPN